MTHFAKRTLLAVLSLACAGGALADSADAALDLARRTYAYVAKSVDAKTLLPYRRELDSDAAWLASASNAPAFYRASIERVIRKLRREILFLHPDLQFATLLAVQRGIPYTWDLHMVDQYVGRFSRPGPGLVAITSWRGVPRARPLLADKLPRGTTLNPDLHWDADRVIFAFCDETRKPPANFDPLAHGLHPDATFNPWIAKADPENPIYHDRGRPDRRAEANRAHLRYFIYECAADGSWVRQLTGTPDDDLKTRDGRQTVLVEDVDPCYLPDGGFAFTSTRAQNFGRCHWGRYTPSFLLYRADALGRNIRPLSFGEANEWEPAVLNDGRIAYTRWDYVNRNAVWHQSLWTIRPDGTGVAHLYGNYSERVCVATEVNPVPGSSRLVATASAHHSITMGSLFLLDPQKGEDGDAPVTRLTPEVPFPESEGWQLGGTYANPRAVNDTLFFCAYSEEPVSFPKGHPRRHGSSNGASWPSPAAFGIYLVDTLGGRELIYRDATISTFNPIPVVKRPRPPVLASQLPPPEKAPPYGVCYVQNVYDSRTGLKPGSVKALRVNRIVNMPACRRETLHQGRDLELYKEYLGEVPVAADGSAAFRIPAGEPIQLQALDRDGMAILTMRSFIHAQKGEVQGCTGCHEQRAQGARTLPVPPGRTPDVPVRRLELGYAGPFSYLRTVAPIVERRCVSCHTGGTNRPPALAGLAGQRFFVEKKLVGLASSYFETHESKPYDYFAGAAPLMKRLRSGHGNVKLTPDELYAFTLWMDFNVPEFSHGGGYSWNRLEAAGPNCPWHDVQGTCGRGGTNCLCRSCWVREGRYNKPPERVRP